MIVCPKRGRENPEGTQACSACGWENLGGSEGQGSGGSPADNPRRKRGVTKWWAIGFGIAIIAGLGGIGGVYVARTIAGSSGGEPAGLPSYSLIAIGFLGLIGLWLTYLVFSPKASRLMRALSILFGVLPSLGVAVAGFWLVWCVEDRFCTPFEVNLRAIGLALSIVGIGGLLGLSMAVRSRPPGPISEPTARKLPEGMRLARVLVPLAVLSFVALFGVRVWWSVFTSPLHSGWAYYRSIPGVQSIAAAPDGTIWVATFFGVSHFDGQEWKDYDPMRGMGYAIAVTPDGLLWVGTPDGVLCFEGQTRTTYTEKDGLAEDFVTSMAVARDGTLWVGSYYHYEDNGGVSHFDGQTWTAYTTADGLGHKQVEAIAVAPDGTVWAGTHGGGVSSFDGDTWTTYTTDDGLAHSDVQAIAVAPDGALWLGTWGGGASRFDGDTWTTYTEDDGLAHNVVWSIVVGPEGALWFGTLGGVSRFDGEEWTTYTTRHGLVDNHVWCIAVGLDGALWFGFGTRANGVSRYMPPD